MNEKIFRNDKMTEKRYYAHKHLLQENQVYDKICHNFMNIDETVEHMNNEYWKYKQLKEEKEQLKQLVNERIKYLKENNFELLESDKYTEIYTLKWVLSIMNGDIK